MTRVLAGLMSAAALTGVVIVHAQTPLNVKLGLWEVTTVNQMSGMPAMPQIDLNNVPPDQRARIEAMMKAQEGLMGGKPVTTKQCLTQEKLDKAIFQDPHMDPSCTHSFVTSTTTVQEVKIACTGNRKMTGTVRFEAVDNEHVKGTVHFDADAEGKPMTINSTVTGQWVTSNCGDVK